MSEVTGKKDALKGSVLLGEAAYFSEDNLQTAKKKEILAVIPDEHYRNRDELLKDGVRREGKERFDARYFKYESEGNYYTCPQGKILKFRSKVKLRRSEGNKYDSKASGCKDCPYRDKCIRSKNKTKEYRTLYICLLRYEENLCQKMREMIDTDEYKKLYSKRLGVIEGVFANITYCKGMRRFTLRGQVKVNTQWTLYCIVHNIGKCNRQEKSAMSV